MEQGATLPEEFNDEDHTLHLHADNVDAQISNLDGHGQLHCMGMFASISPGIGDTNCRIKKHLRVGVEDLRAACPVTIHISDWDGRSPGLVYKGVSMPSAEK